MDKFSFINGKFFKLIKKIFWSNRLIQCFAKNMNDRKYYRINYWWHTLNKINLDNPKLFSEKIVALNLYDNNPLYSTCSDKYLVRFYVDEKLKKYGLESINNELILSTDCIEKINFDNLPNQFVIKMNHGSGWNIIVKDKSTINEKKIKRKLKKWINDNYYFYGRQKQYKSIKPLIVIEKYLENKDGSEIFDYKIMCFDGVPLAIWVDYNRHSHHVRNFYDIDGNPLYYESDVPADYSIPFVKPENYELMIKIAKVLSEDFIQVRVDLYNIDGNIIFGELTFTSFGGYVFFKSRELDETWGNKFHLNLQNK